MKSGASRMKNEGVMTVLVEWGGGMIKEGGQVGLRGKIVNFSIQG